MSVRDALPASDDKKVWSWRFGLFRFLWVSLAGLLLACTACETVPELTATNTSPVPSPSLNVTLALLGDIMLGRDVHPTAETFAFLKPSLLSADLALANLESPLTEAPVQTDSSYVLCAPPKYANVLAEAGFDMLSLANNHRLDCGTEGLMDTQSTLEDSGLGFIGPDPQPVDRLIQGLPLAFLAFDATDDFQEETAVQAIRSARATGATVIVSIHWGAEYQTGISRTQEQIAQDLAVAGAALIWGHHPHVLQPARWINDHQTLVLYSLGNALFDQYGLANTRQSALVLVRLNSVGVQDFQVIPFSIDVQNSRILEASQEEFQVILKYFQ